MSKKNEWKWKDSNRFEWLAKAEQTGEVLNQHEEFNPDGDHVWLCEIFAEDGYRIWWGYYVGQIHMPPMLREVLKLWQQEVNRIVIDGAIDETRKRFSDADGSKEAPEKLAQIQQLHSLYTCEREKGKMMCISSWVAKLGRVV